jgi:hypothetical protein
MKMFDTSLFGSTAMALFRPGSLALLLCGFAAAPAHAQLIPLTSANVIGGSPVIDGSSNPVAYNSGSSAFQPGNIFNQPTGSVSPSGDFINPGYSAWLPAGNVGAGAAGPFPSLANRYVVIDLGANYVLTGIDLFNSTFSQRATGTFSVTASNSITGASADGGFAQGMALSGTVTTLLGSTALSYTNTQPSPVTDQAFVISDTNPYRYVQITLLTATGLDTDPSHNQIFGSGLAEVRISGSVSAIPEPSTYAAIAGAAMLGLATWRRRWRSTPPTALA